jgi:hypothetical protein
MMHEMLRAAGTVSLTLAAIGITNPVTAGAQASCAPASRAIAPGVLPSEFSGVLSTRVSLRADAIPLRDALDRLAASARIRLSYAADIVPLSRIVCGSYESAPVGRVLAELLAGVAVQPVAVGDNQVVLASTPSVPQTAEIPAILKEVGQLDRVVVTGNSSAIIDRPMPAAMDVVDGSRIAAHSTGSVASTIDGAVPGVWVWEQSPLNLLARYGSIRGASSFGVSYPKVYVDGIEVANSLLVTHLDPDAVSRIEMIRGPQGAALYGANAISGVMNIVTRQEGTSNGGARAQIKARGGASASDFSPTNVLVQNHGATLRHGTNARSARLGVTASRIGAFIPYAFSQQLTANGSIRNVGQRTVLTSTFRIFAQDARSPSNPINLSTADLPDSSDMQTVRQFTLSGAATFTSNARWTHSATAGVDGYTLRSAALLESEFPSAIDSALRAASGSAVRATVKTNTVGRFGDQSRLATTINLGVEHSVVRDRTTMQLDALGPVGVPAPWSVAEIRSNTGIVAQATGSLNDALFLTGGVRVERNTSPTGLGEITTLPMLGATAVREIGPATIKLRSAYGKAIRPVQTSSWAGSLVGLRGSLQGTPITPEEQSGIEFGADAFFGKVVALRVTRYDQQAKGLVQPVTVSFRTTSDPKPRTHVVYELQNVGDVSNRGWELQGSLTEGPWSLGATFSKVDSRVDNLSRKYTGDLRKGDRMLEVPAVTYGVNAAWSKGRWFAAWNVSRAADWINYDRLALRRQREGLIGAQLRSYWMSYEGVTRMGGRIGAGLLRGVTFTLDGENLLDEQRGEPDNVTVLPGRTVSAGLTVSF